MKTKNLLGVLLLFTFTFISCDKEDEEGRKITDYKEYVLTVASEMKPGVIWSEGRDYLKEVYLKSATPFPKCYLHKEKWTFDS